MKNTDLYTQLSLGMLPIDEHYVVSGNDFLIMDNFDFPTVGDASDQVVAQFIAPHMPFKIRFHLLLFCVGGFMRFQVNLSEYELRRNEVLILSSDTIGQCMEFSPDCRIVLMAFNSNAYSNMSNTEGMVVIRRFLSLRPTLPVEEQTMEDLTGIYRFLRRKIASPGFRYGREMIAACMQLIFAELCQHMIPYVEGAAASVGDRKRQLYDGFMQMLSEHCGSQRSISFYAERLCVTPKYLSQVVQTVSGRHAGAWIRDYVILEAKVLLRNRNLTVQQISDRLNFPNQSFFGSYFKRSVGCSPKAYRTGHFEGPHKLR